MQMIAVEPACYGCPVNIEANVKGNRAAATGLECQNVITAVLVDCLVRHLALRQIP